MAVTEIKKGVYWVGAVDWNIRSFHGPTFTTPYGTTYNSYLIVDEQITLVDAVYTPFAQELIDHIAEIIDPTTIDNVVVNHIETDHAGALPNIMALNPGARMFATNNAKVGLAKHFDQDWDITVVKSGDTLKTGKYTLSFLEAPMLHWPDSMFTYIGELKLLMPNDAFGQHYASNFRFDDQVNFNHVMDEARKYYANILNPFSKLVLKKLAEVESLGLEIDMIAPSHGIIWRQNPDKILQAYSGWAKGESAKKVVILYDTMWESTTKLAKAFMEGITEAGVEAALYQVSKTDHNDILTDVINASAVLIGSSTVNNNILPSLSPILDELVGLKAPGKIGLAFGSQGWAGGAVKTIEQRLTEAGVEMHGPAFVVKWLPNGEELQRAKELGKEIAMQVVHS